MDQNRIDEINRQLARIEEYGPDVAIHWLRTAFHSHEQNIEILKHRNSELRKLLLCAITRPLTVAEARLCVVCRICRGAYVNPSGDKSVFVFNSGKEFAHQSCLEKETAHAEIVDNQRTQGTS